MRRLRVVGGILAGCGALVGCVWLYGPVLGFVNRLTQTPAEVRAPYIETLSRSRPEAEEQCRRLVQAWQMRQSYGLHRIVLTVEATPVEVWLITAGGKLTLVRDYTRDSYSNRAIYVLHPKSVEPLGDEAEAHPNGEWFPRRAGYHLRFSLPDGSVEHF